MKRAVLTAPGVAEWYEMCFCPHRYIMSDRRNTTFTLQT